MTPEAQAIAAIGFAIFCLLAGLHVLMAGF